MRQRAIGRDTQLTVRMGLTMFLLGMVYAGFILVLWSLGVDLIFLIVLAFIFALFQYLSSDRMVLWSMRARIVDERQAPKLHGMVERLAVMAGIPKPRVAISNLNVPNAFATGRNPKRAVVAVTTGLLHRLTDEELEAVLAHEITHIKNRDVQVMTIASFFLMVISMVLHSLMWMGLFGGLGGYGYGRRSGGQFMAVVMLMMLVSLVTYFLAQLLILALSRYRELAADRGGALITGRPAQLAAALVKIDNTVAMTPERDLREVQEGASAFCIVPALKRDSLAALFSTHPPVAERVRRLRRLQEEMEA